MDIEVTGNQHQPRNSIYNVLVILAKTLRHQSPDTTFPDRVGVLVNTRSANQLRAMGFPEDWKERPIWLLT
jgi:abortive infection bacteriophage resistance protein